MILFVGDDKGILFVKTIIEVIVDSISTAYKNLVELIPSRKNITLGGMSVAGLVYCRVCIDRLHIKWGSLKYITHQHKVYNCVECGYKITKTNIKNRYFKINKIGKRGFN